MLRDQLLQDLLPHIKHHKLQEQMELKAEAAANERNYAAAAAVMVDPIHCAENVA